MAPKFLPEGLLEKTIANREALASVGGLERAWRTGMILEAPALLCDNLMRLHIDLGPMRGIMEREECVWCRPGEPLKDIAIITRVGKTIAFRIIGFGEENGERVALLSRRSVQEDCVTEFLSGLIPGDIIPARVTHLENYGAFVDIGCGVSALLSIDCISVSRITHPRDRLRVGQMLSVAIKSIDRTLSRVFVTLKELLGTWEENAACFRAGETVVGRVRSIESYGIFVELSPNLAGLAELRSNTGQPLRCAVGDAAAVFIKSILPDRMKIKLVMIDSAPCDEPPIPLKYYINPEEIVHISHWEYSPPCATRLIETIF